MALASVITSLLIVEPASPAPSQAPPAKITWFPPRVELVLRPGDSAAGNYVISNTRDLGDVVLEAVPEIAPFVTVEPQAFANLSAEEGTVVRLSFSIPDSTPLGTYNGAVHVRSNTSPVRTYARPLPVILRVENLLPPAPDALQTFSSLADEIEAGDLDSALRRFPPSPLNRQVLMIAQRRPCT